MVVAWWNTDRNGPHLTLAALFLTSHHISAPGKRQAQPDVTPPSVTKPNAVTPHGFSAISKFYILPRSTVHGPRKSKLPSPCTRARTASYPFPVCQIFPRLSLTNPWPRESDSIAQATDLIATLLTSLRRKITRNPCSDQKSISTQQQTYQFYSAESKMAGGGKKEKGGGMAARSCRVARPRRLRLQPKRPPQRKQRDRPPRPPNGIREQKAIPRSKSKNTSIFICFTVERR
ncbi:hypothetical protein B0T17DRAFT_94796 [Bombardia bombarda]|uniref:Uncharacterized protein n=1 Tax=Bombardia bombarda TaxID=252184 RepID=A0AA39XN22_9PEZI|nr:hypothetical protein B0T17DRAFT_94796 [Bombardia bombarda]